MLGVCVRLYVIMGRRMPLSYETASLQFRLDASALRICGVAVWLILL